MTIRKPLTATVNSYAANQGHYADLVGFEKIYAPFDGVITMRNTDNGWLIAAGLNTPGQELFQIGQISTLRVFVAVPEVYSRAARVGSKATLTLDEYPDQTFQGTITRTSSSIDMASRTLNTEVDIDNSKGLLLPGAYVRVHLALPAQIHSVIIPSIRFCSVHKVYRSEWFAIMLRNLFQSPSALTTEKVCK